VQERAALFFCPAPPLQLCVAEGGGCSSGLGSWKLLGACEAFGGLLVRRRYFFAALKKKASTLRLRNYVVVYPGGIPPFFGVHWPHTRATRGCCVEREREAARLPCVGASARSLSFLPPRAACVALQRLAERPGGVVEHGVVGALDAVFFKGCVAAARFELCCSAVAYICPAAAAAFGNEAARLPAYAPQKASTCHRPTTPFGALWPQRGPRRCWG
jgi:hypothetical protein